MVEIHEQYRTYTPPRWVAPTVNRLLASVPAESLSLLEAIVLTDGASIGKGKTQRVCGRKHRRNECRGFYHQQWKGKRAWIQVVVDNTIKHIPQSFFFFQIARDFALGEVLYHEIGHHLHATFGSAARGGESSADDWSRKLVRIHMRRYWYLRPIAKFFLFANRMRQRFARRKKRPKTSAN